MPEMVIYSCFHMVGKWVSILQVICRLKSMPWIPFFRVLSMLVEQSSLFAICYPPRMVYNNYLSRRLSVCWIRGRGKIRLTRVYRFFIGSILWWWWTRYTVHEQTINWQLVDGHSDAPIVVEPYGSGWYQPAAGWIPAGDSLPFISIGWYCWSWASSRFLLNIFYLQI
jgi:hypothetical protein